MSGVIFMILVAIFGNLRKKLYLCTAFTSRADIFGWSRQPSLESGHGGQYDVEDH